jgi:amino acid adenylation domain-containing protein
MSDIAKQITELSDEKRQLLDRLLKKAGLNLTSAIIIPQRRDTNKFPMSFAQERLWFLDQLEPNRPTYNLPDTHYFKGPLDLDALQRSLSEIVRRHELLRTTFQMVDGKPMQVIAPPQPLELPLIDISHLPDTERAAKAQQLADEDSIQPFDLSRDPLFRMQLVRLAEEEHLLLFTMHHIISDGWSLQVMAREMSALYEAYKAGQSFSLPELPIQYADFAVWQREWLQGEVLEKQLEYWREQLGGELPELELPFDYARPARRSYRGDAANLELNGEVSRRLKEIARESGTTFFMTLLAAFNVLLWRYTGQDDLLVGTPIANRTRRETENLIGFFVNTLVLRTKIKASSSFRELLEQVRQTTLGAYEHQDVPFEKLVEELQPERSLNRNPLFQVLFALQDAGELKLTGLELTWMDTQTDIAKFDLSFYITEMDAGLYLCFEYDTDLFERATITRMLRHFQILAEKIAANPDAKLSELEILTQAERDQLWELNQNATDYGRDLCLHQIFESQVAAQPQALAVIDGEEQVTYEELNQRANQLAHFLRSKGVGPDVRVGVLLDRSLEFDVAVLGILKAGGAYVPLDNTYPRQRLQFMMEDAGMRLVLTEQDQSEVVTDATIEVVYLDNATELFASESRENPGNMNEADDLAYVMYTSGSTGQPKGVAVMHHSINRLVRNTNYIQFDNSCRLAQGSNVSFDASTLEIWGALLNGGTLIVLPRDTVLSPLELKRAISKQQINAMWLTTSLFNQMAQSVPEAFASLRYMVFGGEASDAQAAKRVLERGRPQHLINGYGPTEGTTFTACYEVNEVAAGARTLPIGRAISNTEVWVLDQQMQLAPAGIAGELYIGGDGLAREYLGRPELTAEKFVPHPYSTKPGARLYRTGDMVRYLSDGNLDFLKRRDHQVKIRGFRVELGEIEAALDQYWGITESVVIDRDDPGGGTRLIAYIVPEEGVEPTSAELYAFLKEKIPTYMIPSIFVTIEKIPLTPNGKVNRRELPVPEFSEDEASANFMAPRTPVEETLAEIWRETLSVSQVGVESNFFDLGGHSLLATRVISQIREKFGVELPLRVLFESPTIAGLGQHLDTVQSKETELQRILSMLENVESISEEEVTALLAKAEAAG